MVDIITNSLRYDKNQLYVTFDYETCCLNTISLDNKPWNLGYVISQNFEIKETHNIYIKWPDLRVSEDAARITRFDPTVIEREGRDPERVLEHFEKYLYDKRYRILGYNILQFDCYVHNIFRKLLGKQPDYSYIDRCIDVLSLVKADKGSIPLLPEENFYFWMLRVLSLRQRGIKSNLTAACKDYGIKIDENLMHMGSVDCVQTTLLFFELIKKFNIQ